MSKRQRLGALALAAIVAVVAFVVLGPSDEEQTSPDRRNAAQADRSTARPGQPAGERAKPEYTTIRLRDGEPVGGMQEIPLESGETARLEFRSDRPSEIHIHGYDRYVQVAPGEPARTRFETDLEGIFEIEDHDTATPVAELRVSP